MMRKSRHLLLIPIILAVLLFFQTGGSSSPVSIELGANIFAPMAVLAGPSAPSLGSAQSFAVLGGSAVTNTGDTTVHGDLGVSPGSAVSGFPPGTVTGGTIHAADATAAQAQSDLTAAYNDLAGRACNTDLTGQDLGGLTLKSGVYCFSTSAQLTGALVLDAEGDSNAVFIFQIGSTLTTASGSSVSMINSGNTCNVFWQVGSSATLGTSTAFTGSILVLTSITLTTNAGMDGRALARNGAVTMDTNDISNACQSAPPPAATATAIPTETSTATATATATESATATNTATATATATESATATNTATATATATESATATSTATATATATESATATSTASPTATNPSSPTATSTVATAPTHTKTPNATHTLTPAPTHTATRASTHAPTKAPTSAPTKAPTSAPTKAPTSAPTAAPTSVPATLPTNAPTLAPTSAPTAAPSPTPTPAPAVVGLPATGGAATQEEGQSAPLTDTGISLHAGLVDTPLDLRIPSLELSIPVVGVGTTSENVMDAPRGLADDPVWQQAFWYRGSAIPGDLGTATIAGHVTDALGRPAAFARLKDLVPGDVIVIHDTQTELDVRFVVVSAETYSVEQAAADLSVLEQIYGSGPVLGLEPQPASDGRSHLTLITCSGDWIHGAYDHRLIVYAEREQAMPPSYSAENEQAALE